MTLCTVKFRLGRYKYASSPETVNGQSWIIGREDDGEMIGFAFTEAQAQHICLALNLVDAHIRGRGEDKLRLLRELTKLQTH